jgi:glycine cleavage system H protein
MDGFTYHNIFETKGIEYVAIIAFFAILVPFWMILNRQVKATKQIQKKLSILTANALRVPQGIFFSKNHTWTHLDSKGVAKVGMDDLLLHLTGELSFSKLKTPGETISKEDLLLAATHDGKHLQILSPISGEILAVNPMLKENPGILNEDPFVSGWIYKIRPSRWIAETNSFFLAEEASNWSAKELERFKDFLANSVERYTSDPSQVVLQDGGELIDQPLAHLPEEVWQDFQRSFLGTKSKYPHFRGLEKGPYPLEYD